MAKLDGFRFVVEIEGLAPMRRQEVNMGKDMMVEAQMQQAHRDAVLPPSKSKGPGVFVGLDHAKSPSFNAYIVKCATVGCPSEGTLDARRMETRRMDAMVSDFLPEGWALVMLVDGNASPGTLPKVRQPLCPTCAHSVATNVGDGAAFRETCRAFEQTDPDEVVPPLVVNEEPYFKTYQFDVMVNGEELLVTRANIFYANNRRELELSWYIARDMPRMSRALEAKTVEVRIYRRPVDGQRRGVSFLFEVHEAEPLPFLSLDACEDDLVMEGVCYSVKFIRREEIGA